MQGAFALGLPLLTGTGRGYQQLHAGCHMPTLQHAGRRTQVFELGAGASADVGNAGCDISKVADRAGIRRAVRRSHLRRQGAGIKRMQFAIGTFIAAPVAHILQMSGCHAGAAQIGHGGGIGCNQAGLGTESAL